MAYGGRPGASPVLATLFAQGAIKRSHAVLDVGCGDGTDCIALDRWGVRRAVGIDADEDVIEKAKRRCERNGASYDLHCDSITKLHGCFRDREFDVVIDSLCWNNVHANAYQATGAYVKQVWRILKPGGLLVIQQRDNAHRFDTDADGTRTLPPSFHRYFSFGPAVTTHLAERRRAGGPRTWANVTVCVGRRRRAPIASR